MIINWGVILIAWILTYILDFRGYNKLWIFYFLVNFAELNILRIHIFKQFYLSKHSTGSKKKNKNELNTNDDVIEIF